MPISSLAFLISESPSNSQSLRRHDFYNTPSFQQFVAEVETLLEQRLVELSLIATSRSNAKASDQLCDLALEALLYGSHHCCHNCCHN
ncbi:MAG: hypothetical protein Kow00121_48860 [Elainellaceae cyanobacterium]